jgi:hypothetical protein
LRWDTLITTEPGATPFWNGTTSRAWAVPKHPASIAPAIPNKAATRPDITDFLDKQEIMRASNPRPRLPFHEKLWLMRH